MTQLPAALSNRQQTALKTQGRLRLLKLGRLHASYADPVRVRDCFPNVPPTVLKGLMADPRFAERLSLKIGQRYRLQPVSVYEDNPLAALLAKGREHVRRIVRLSGAIWYANNFRQVVMAKDRQKLDEILGEGVMTFALKHLSLAPSGMPQPLGDNVLLTLDRAGAACLAVWTRDWLPVYLARIHVMMPPELWPAQVTAEHVSRAPRIVSAAMAEVGA